VLVAWTGLVTHRIIEVEEDISQDDLNACANYLNANFARMCLSEIRARLLELMREEKALYDSLLKNVVSVGERAFAGPDEAGTVYLDGTSHILDQPEFDDLDRMRSLFKTFEAKGRLVKILNAYLAEDGLRIFIGHENLDPDLKDLALVAAGYPAEGGARWGLGVMGSTRMEYGRVITLVDHVARAVSQALSELSA
jgi:heat-inducible transcriptional repressor